METGKVYRHKRCLDLDLSIFEIRCETEKTIKIFGAWLNRHLKTQDPLCDLREEVIWKKDLPLWKDVTEEWRTKQTQNPKLLLGLIRET